jgi:hypothetical protein
MLRLGHHQMLQRKMRQDEVEDLGKSTVKAIKEAVDAGRLEEAKALADYSITESKGLHDLMCDWVYDLLDKVAKKFGELAMYEVLKSTQETWMMKRSWKGYLKLSVKERVELTTEVLRSHRCGPDQDGDLTIVEDAESISIVMDPCGSGGRMRRGDVVDGTPSRLGPPYNFGVTQEAHTFSWSKKDVPYYCIHCAVNETVMMENGGHPLWVTEFDHDARKPCAWKFYKRADDIPDVYYSRLGFKKPKTGEGQY